MIYENTPYCSKEEGKHIGRAYNRFMQMLPHDHDFALFRDHDTCFTHYNWYPQIEQIVAENPECGAFTCVANRIYCKYQRANVDRNSDDMKYHWQMGESLYKQYGTQVKDVTNDHWMSGVMILLRKDVWKKIKGFPPSGMLGIDNRFHQAIRRTGQKLYLMKGVYLYHVYSFNNLNTKRDVSHLK